MRTTLSVLLTSDQLSIMDILQVLAKHAKKELDLHEWHLICEKIPVDSYHAEPLLGSP